MGSSERLIQFAIGGAMGLIGLVTLARAIYFNFIAARATGTVIGGTRGRGDDTPQDLVEFQTPEGRTVRFASTGPSWTGRKIVRGKTVDVRYNRARPDARPIVWSPVPAWIRPALYFGLALVALLYR